MDPAGPLKGAENLVKTKPEIAVVTVVGIGALVYIIRKREAAANLASNAATPELDYQGAGATIGSMTDGGGSGGYYPGSTEGAFYGQNQASDVPTVTITDPTGATWSGPVQNAPAVWWQVNPVGGGSAGGPPNTSTDFHDPPDAPDPPWVPPPYQGPPPAPDVPHPASTPAPVWKDPISVPSWAGPGHKYPFDSDRGWYRVVLVDRGPHKGRWHYYGPNDNPKIKVA